MKIKPPKEQKDIERAIALLVDSVRECCRNQKPLILHSIRVGMKLLALKQPKEVVIAGLLHDLVEDTNCPLSRIEREFGSRVANLVYALSQEKIKGYKRRWHVLLAKIKKAGKDAMIIKVVDSTDNIQYVPLIKNKKALEAILWKVQFTIESLEPHLRNLEIFKQFKITKEVILEELKKRS